jgi:hypothetical protein
VPLGTPSPPPGAGNPGKSSGIPPQTIPDAARQAMLNLEIQNLEAIISQQQSQIDVLATQAKEQIAQIEEVNARLKIKNQPAKNIVNNPKAVP